MIELETGILHFAEFLGPMRPHMKVDEFLATCGNVWFPPPFDPNERNRSYGFGSVTLGGTKFHVSASFEDQFLVGFHLFYSISTDPPRQKPPSKWEQIFFKMPPLPSREECLKVLANWVVTQLGQTTPSEVYTWGTVTIVDDRIREGTYLYIKYA